MVWKVMLLPRHLQFLWVGGCQLAHYFDVVKHWTIQILHMYQALCFCLPLQDGFCWAAARQLSCHHGMMAVLECCRCS